MKKETLKEMVRRVINEEQMDNSKEVRVTDLKVNDRVKFVSKRLGTINANIINIDNTEIKFTNLDYPNGGVSKFLVQNLINDPKKTWKIYRLK
jgi:hypothetical protein